MALTRANVVGIMLDRLEPLMSEAGMSTTDGATNADVQDPMAWAVRRMGYSTASPDTVTDAELTSVGDSDWDDYLDLCEYRLLKSIQGNLAVVDVQAGPRQEKLSQLQAQVASMIQRMIPFVQSIVRKPTAGYLTLDFAEHGEDRL